MIFNGILVFLSALSLILLFWQWMAARRFHLHSRGDTSHFAPPVTLLKPIKGSDAHTEACLRSWFAQRYQGPVQILFGVASLEDSACKLIHKLIGEFPHTDAQLIVCGPLAGANAKVSKLAQLQPRARHEILVVSDADVCVPDDFLAAAVQPFAPKSSGGLTAGREPGLVNCFYQLANPTTLAMRWEALAINADFWSQVLQSKTLKPLDFALGAVMLTRRPHLEKIGGFEALMNCLADDYQLGHRIARQGHEIVLSPVVVECWDPPQTWKAVWTHQLRWARTIRVCQPAPYFFSILSNPTCWPLLWLVLAPTRWSLGFCGISLAARLLTALDLQARLTRSLSHAPFIWMAPVKDLIQVGIWLGAFTGNTVEWRGVRFRLRRDGTLVKN